MNARAQRKGIKKAKEDNSESLDLSGRKITELVEEIGELTSLKFLYLSHNQLKDLPDTFLNLTNLKILDISNNEMEVLPPQLENCVNLYHLDCYGNIKMKDLYVIGKLIRLEMLNAYDISIQTFPESMSKCKALRSIDFASTQISSIPSWISKLKKLNTLHLANCRLEDISEELFNLGESLEILHLFKNKIQNLSDNINKLKNLKYLDIHGNKLTELTREIQELKELKYLNLQDNPFKPEILPEVLKKPEDVKGILEYFSQIWNEEKEPLNEGKIVIVGDEFAGKSSVVKRLVDDEFSDERIVTEKIEIKPYKIKLTAPKNKGYGEQDVKLNVWDFGGQEIMHSTHEYFLSERSLYLIVLDLSKGNSISEICEENRLNYWITKIEDKIKDSPVIIVGNKLDKCQNQDFREQISYLIRTLKGNYPKLQIKDFLTISCKDISLGTTFARFKDRIHEEISKIEEVFHPFPLHWRNVKGKLEEMREKKITSYSLDEYYRICEGQNVNERDAKETLLEILYRIGTILHFKGSRFDGIQSQILEPEWVINGIYAVINSPELKNADGVLNMKLLNNILTKAEFDNAYPLEKQRFILGMIKEFKLCYEPDRKIYIPAAFPDREPYYGEGWNNSIKLTFQYEEFQSSIIEHFIVEVFPYIVKSAYWHSGGIIEYEGTEALVKAIKKEKKIEALVKKTDKKMFLFIKEIFDKIHKEYKDLEVKVFVEVPNESKI